MRRWMRIVFVVALIVLSAATFELGRRTRAEAHRLLTNPMATRRLPTQRPIDYGMVYDEVTARTADGLALAGWFVAPSNGALVLLSPLLTVVPLHLFALELATAKGHDVDQPRNLAKSVTVE